MLLTSIQIQGFKSFADKTVLKFGRGVTAIVGPNGSGKSNISDAVRWVLGEQSTKNLRGQSMEDVIFGGTDLRRPHGYCEVTLNIDNSDRSLPFDNDSVAITRRYYRSHESEYQINHVAVRLKDIHELFMDTGLGRDGYSVIGQGKIDTIIGSRSDERRDIFEEASGISKYRYRKLEAERKLTAAEDNLLRLHDILDELKGRVGPLADQSEKAQKFLAYSETKKELEIGLWLYTLSHSKEALRAQEAKLSAVSAQYRELEEKLSSFDRLSEENAASYAALTAEIEEKRTAIAATKEDVVKQEGEILVLQNDIAHNEESVAQLKNEESQLGISDQAARKEAAAKRAAAEEKNRRLTELQHDLNLLEEQLSGLLSDSETLSRKIEEQVLSLNTLTARSADFRVKMVSANAAVEELAARRSALNETLAQNAQETARLEAEYRETETLLTKTEETIESCRNTVKGYELRLQSRKEAAETCQAEGQEIRLDYEAKKRRVAILKELENNMEGFSHAVKVVMGEAEKGTLRGVHGTVSKLISVDKRFTVAIETALGNAIQNVVVDSETDAKRAIALLKSQNAGRATFLPISSVVSKNLTEDNLKNDLGFLGIASDLVECEDRYREIVRSLLSGTAVAEDIDSAIAIAKAHRYRVKVVSLDGQVVHPGGSLTGGSLVKQAGLLSRGQDIVRLEAEIKKLSERATENEKKQREANEAVSKVESDLLAVRAELTTANEDRIRALAEGKRLSDLLAGLQTSLADLQNESRESDAKQASLKEEAASAAAEMARIENEKTSFQSEIDKMSGGRDTLTEHRQQLSDSITEVKLQQIDCEKDCQALLAAAETLESAIAGRAERGEAIKAQMAAFAFRNTQLLEDIAKQKDHIADLQNTIRETEAAMEERIAARNENEKQGIALRNSEREQLDAREKLSGELARLTERKESMMREYDEIIRQLYDEYQLTKSEAEAHSTPAENPAESKRQITELKSKIRALGNVNVSAIDEYREVKERYDFLSDQIADVENSRTELHKLIGQLTAQMKEMFLTGFAKINENFGVCFQKLFGGGSACLKLTDPENVLESGIDIEAHLPGKNVPSLDGLSGGEKALVALSIYFAIMKVNAPPFCFLDEVDTALDDINVDRFADYMKSSDLSTQFICVTHRRGTMEGADMLYGVTMQEKGVTKLLELDVARLEKELLKNQGA